MKSKTSVLVTEDNIDIQGSRILITDDNKQDVLLIEGFLAAAGYQPISAFHGRECLELAKEDPPDLIILDIIMPEIDGFEVLEKLKDDSRTKRIPVIIITSLEDEKERIKGLERGASDFLTKPINRLELYARIRSLLHPKLLYDALENSYLQMEQLQDQKEALTNLLVNDMKNILTVLNGNLYMARKCMAGEEEEKSKKLIEESEECCFGLMSMVSDVLNIARLEEEKFPLNRERLDLAEEVVATLKQLLVVARSEKRDLTWNVPSPCTAVFDREIVQRVLTNLVLNAVHHAPEESEVQVDFQIVEEVAKVAVHDQGPGIPAEYHQTIFDRFSQVGRGETSGNGGHGLGLTFCKLAVEAHGGKIYVAKESSEPGRGTTIIFTLPLENQ